jgi:hypothetical protein
LPDWLSTITESELSDGGQARRLRNTNGDTIVERLATVDAAARSYSDVTVDGLFRSPGCAAGAGRRSRHRL